MDDAHEIDCYSLDEFLYELERSTGLGRSELISAVRETVKEGGYLACQHIDGQWQPSRFKERHEGAWSLLTERGARFVGSDLKARLEFSGRLVRAKPDATTAPTVGKTREQRGRKKTKGVEEFCDDLLDRLIYDGEGLETPGDKVKYLLLWFENHDMTPPERSQQYVIVGEVERRYEGWRERRAITESIHKPMK